MGKVKQYQRDKMLRRIARLARAKARASQLFYGTARPEDLAPYVTDFVIDEARVRMMLSRDAGMHSGGWFKNPDYERCWHLSLSFRSPDGQFPLPQDHKVAQELCRHVFGDKVRFLWVESPKHPDPAIKGLDVWHYRLMCDAHWQPIKPRGEVYTLEFTEKGWRSFSEIHGHKPLMVQEA